MRRLLPSPLLSATLFATWLMLNRSLSLGHLLIAALLALALPLLTRGWRLPSPRVRRPAVAVRLLATVVVDIVRSNIELARRVLGPQATLRPGFVWVPLTLRDPHGLVALASIVTLTPGTVSAGFDTSRRHLLVHCFHLDGDGAEAAVIESIQARYEAPLKEILE